MRNLLQNLLRLLLQQALRLSRLVLLVLLRVLRRLMPPLDWRLLIWLVGFALLLTSSRMAWLQAVDRQLFRLGAALLPAPSAPAALDVLHLTGPQLQQLLHDPLADGQTTALLYALMAHEGPVGMVLPELPRRQAFSAERLLQDTPNHSPLHQAWQAREQLRTRFLHWLASPQVYLASPAHAPYLDANVRVMDDRPVVGAAVNDNPSHDANKDANTDAPPPLLQRLAMADIPVHPTLAVATGGGAFHVWPIHFAHSEDDALTQPLLWRHGDSLYPGWVLALLHSTDGDARYRWRAPQTLLHGVNKFHDANNHSYPLNSDGSIYPAFQALTGLTPARNPLDRQQFLQRPRQQNPRTPLLIGVNGDPTMERLASTLQSLRSGQYFHAPWWAVAVEKVLLALILVYAVWLMPKLGNGVRLLVSVLVLLVLATTQLGYQITRLQWLPLGSVIQYLIFATLMVMLWRKQQQPVEQLQQQHQSIAVPWSRHLLQQGQLDQALAALQSCATSPDVLELLYEIGGQHERKRRPAAAIAVYQALQQRKRRYKDVSKRIKQLEQPQAVVLPTQAQGLSKTVVIADAHSQPQFGRYQVESELGRGAMGVVYLGFDPKIARKVAIKTLDYSRYEGDELAAVKARFFREAEAAGRLRHPNIVSVYDVGEDHDLAYIAMDYVEGQPLSDFTSRKAPLPVAEVYRIIADVADALHYAHREHIVHRDIKPSNILYNRDAQKVTVTDFGIARIISDKSTQTGEILGSPLYMSPEQILGKKVDKASDIFSLGVTLFQLLAGELPFKGDNIAELSRQILQGKPANIRDLRPDLPPSARRIINKALQKEPGDRYRDAAEMANALRNAQ